jgi:hypothetical protein
MSFLLRSLRGGLNNSDPAIGIPDDQCTVATNVEFNKSMLGERRRGTSGITLSSGLAAKDRVTFLFRHLPTTDETASQLWVLGVTGTSSYRLEYKDTAWSGALTISDTVSLSSFDQYRWQAVSLHGKLFLAFNSDVDRLHVYDGTSIRRVGISTPSAPTTAETGVAGSFIQARYYRVRFTKKSGSTVLVRSEPSASATRTPSGTKTGITVTKPTSPGDSETHWELEASLDNVNFYLHSDAAIATTTITDTTANLPGYAAAGLTLSEDTGDYTVPWSARYLTVDGDRLIFGGSYEDSSKGSRIGWTPVGNADGKGNDERYELDTDPTIDLDGFEGGDLTGLSSAAAGSFFAFKINHIYKLVRTGERDKAYDVVVISKERGALHGSIVQGVDQFGKACIYFLDPNVGPCRFGANGLEWLGSDIRESWALVNKDATQVVCSGIYDPINRQVIWNIATSSANIPSLSLVLQTDAVRAAEDGTKRGWATWNGNRAKALCMCLYSDNVEAGTARSRNLRPLIGLEGLGLVHLTDTGSTDNTVSYTATITTKPYVLSTILSQFGILAGAVLMKAVAATSVAIQIVRDFGLETTTAISLSAVATASETVKKVRIDNLRMTEATTVQFTFSDDAPTTTGRWELHQLALKTTTGQSS